MIGIYKITSPNGKIYIGRTKCIDTRWSAYERLDCKSQPKLYRSLLKHGVSNHVFEYIEECGEEDLKRRERYWQEFYNVISRNGLNCILEEIDGMPCVVSEETRRKLGDAARGKTQRKEVVLQRAISNTGKKRTLEQKERMSRAGKGKIMSETHKRNIFLSHRKRTEVINTNTGQVYDSMKNAAKDIGMTIGCFKYRLKHNKFEFKIYKKDI